MKREYKKPLMQVEKYAVNNTFCESCNRITIDMITVPKANQYIHCIANSAQEGCFNSNSGCSNIVSVVTLSGTYSSDDNKSLATWIYYGAKSSQMSQYNVVSGDSKKYTASYGQYVIWSNSEGHHAGPITEEIDALFGFSY